MLFPKVNSNTFHGHSQAKILSVVISPAKNASFMTLILIYYFKMHSLVTEIILKKFKLFTEASASVRLLKASYGLPFLLTQVQYHSSVTELCCRLQFFT